MFLYHLRLISNSFPRPSKKLQKTFIFLLRETKNPLLLHPLSERERVLKTAGTLKREREVREADAGRLKKRLKKFLEETEKALHLQPVSERKTDKAEA